MGSRLLQLLGVGLTGVAGLLIIGLAWVDQPSSGSTLVSSPSQVTLGRRLFVAGCSSCHGMSATGISGRGPSLIGAGAQAADFYLSTGRMPLSAPGQVPHRSHPAYPPDQIDALVAYIGSLGGPPIPGADPSAGSLSRGSRLFAATCAGCHQITGTGGVVPGGSVPALSDATPTQIAEAIRIGPYLMPRFNADALNQQDVNSIARYVLDSPSHPLDAGGWSLGHLGPIPEGMVAWFVAIGALLAVARLIGERSE
jgi:ubiquinol-cytochrome c reductase cytochrome c subunit